MSNQERDDAAEELAGETSRIPDKFQPLMEGVDREQFFRQWMDSDLEGSDLSQGNPGAMLSLWLTTPPGDETKLCELEVPGQYVIGSDESADIRLPNNSAVPGRCGCLILESHLTLFIPFQAAIAQQADSAIMLQIGQTLTVGQCQIRIQTDHATGLDPTVDQPTSEDAPIGFSIAGSKPLTIRGYTINEKIGEGGNGAVYRATQLGTNRIVAIKTLLPELVLRERSRQLFYREASIASHLDHPQIVSCLGFGVEGDIPYLVMEYIPSIPIATVLSESADSRRVRLSLGIAIKMLAAIEYAHDQSIIHRDIKPSNVLAYKVDGRLHIKLSDFGLAKSFLTAGYSGITGSKDVCGTLAYMSPEQLLGSRDVGPASDLYSVVVCLYEFLSGHLPHQGETVSDLIRAKLDNSPPLIQQLNPSVGFELAGLIEQGLSRDPGARFQTASELSQSLNAIRQDG